MFKLSHKIAVNYLFFVLQYFDLCHIIKVYGRFPYCVLRNINNFVGEL